MERQNLFSGRRPVHVQHAMKSPSRKSAVDDDFKRPARSPATASPYRLPISPASFYASPSHTPSKKRADAFEAPDTKLRRTATDTEESRDEIDFLTPAPSLHSRMRGKAKAPVQPSTTRSLTVRARAVFVSQAYGSTADGFEVVSFQTHLAVMHNSAECIKVALRDVQSLQLGGSEHACLSVSVSSKSASARSLASLCGETSLHANALLVFMQPHDPAWQGVYDRMRSCIQAEILSEAACMALYNDALRLNTKPFCMPGEDKPPPPPRKPTPIVIGERRRQAETGHEASVAEDTHAVLRQTRARTRSEQLLKEAQQSKPIVQYPASGPFAVTLLQSDLDRLKEDEYLNDTMIEFGLRYLIEQIKCSRPDLTQQIHVFNTFFYHKLTEHRDRAKTYEHLRKWTNRVNIFDKKYVVVPINEHMHWYLAIIVNPRAVLHERVLPMPSARRTSSESAKAANPAASVDSLSPDLCGGSDSSDKSQGPPEQAYVLVLDSMGTSHGPVKTALRDYLRLEARDKHHVDADMDLKRLGDPVHVDVRVPDQPNFSDCGVYLLHYFDRFFSDPDKFFEISIASKRGSSVDSSVHADWRSEDVTTKRAWWTSVIADLAKHSAPPQDQGLDT